MAFDVFFSKESSHPAPGDGSNAKIAERMESLGLTFEPTGHPVEFLSLSGSLGAPVRATVSSFGPLLLGKVLDLNETQTSILSLVFKYCDDNNLPLLDLNDLATTLKFLDSEEGKPFLEEYGGIVQAYMALRSAVEASQGVLRPSAMNMLEDVIQGHRPFSFLPWRLISFGAWMRRFNVQVSAA